MEMKSTGTTCGGCENGRKNSEKGVYCCLFGIMVYREHKGCRYHRDRTDGGSEPKRD